MIAIGKYNTLRIAGKNIEGLSLTDGQQEILLPFNEVPKNVSVGDNLEVFVFVNKAGKTVGTTKNAKAEAEDFAFLTVIDTNENGAYLDLGIDKDVFVPNREQKRPMEKGEQHVVFLHLDDQDRLVASSKLDRFSDQEFFDFEEGDEVSLLIADKSDLGYNAVINNLHMGLLYKNEIFTELHPGDVRRGWIRKIRLEGKIDLTLQPKGFGHILDTKEVILKELKESKGIIALGDKSSPEEIYERFQISKSAFKKAIGGLYKERLIAISDDQIKLVFDSLAD